MQTQELLNTIQTAKGKERYKAFLELLNLAGKSPNGVSPIWDDLVQMLDEEKTDTTYIPMQILGTLAEKGDKRFIKIFEKYSALLSHKSVVIAPHAAKNLGLIAKSIPELEPQITEKLLNLDKLIKTANKGLVYAYAIEGLRAYYKSSKRKEEIIKLVEKQLKSTTPKAVKNAKEFLKRL